MTKTIRHTKKPTYIVFYRDEDKEKYLGFWTKEPKYDELSQEEFLYWKERGVRIRFDDELSL